ncbi:MAG: T9SS type A sorting domain-containing protein [Bacteroidota bacterium]
MKRIAGILIATTLISQSFAQNWVNLMLDRDANFYDVKEAFENQWSQYEGIRGTGYKQFKRWEYFMEPRVYPTGERVSGKFLMKAISDKNKMNPVAMKSDQPWEPIGPTSWTGFGWNPGLGRVNASYVDPTDSEHIYVATPAGGLWESLDDGQSWTPLTDSLVAIGASAIAVNPDNPDIIYLATGDGNASDTYSFGVIKSIDGGQSWETTNLGFEISENEICTDMIMDPNNPEKLIVTSNQGVFITENGGENWNQPMAGFMRDVAIHPGNSEIIYVCGTTFYKSVNGGESFSQVFDGLPTDAVRLEMAVTPANDELVYIIAGNNSNFGFEGFYRSTDEGDSFTQMSDSPNILGYSQNGQSPGGQAWYDLAIAASPIDQDRVFVGGINVWESNNGGSSWSPKSHWYYPPDIGYTHADIHSLDFFGNSLYCGSDGGIFRSVDNGNSWEDISEGLQISQYYRIALSQTDPSKILAGSQDNGTNLFSAQNGYVHLLGGDGNGAAIDYTNDDIMYASYPGGSYQRSTNGGLSFNEISGGINENGAWVTPFEIHPTNPNILFAAYENVWKNENGNWAPISDFGNGSTLREMRVSPSNPDVILTSTFSTLYLTQDGGDSWDNVSSGLPNLFIEGIEVDPQNDDRIWVCFSDYEEGEKVYYSPDAGITWENISNNLPNIPINCIHYLNGSDDGIYIGTDIGVFYKDQSIENWSPYNEGLPNVIVNQLVFHYPTQQIFLASYGRGIWKNGYFNGTDLQPMANFSANRNEVCPSDSVTYTNLSLNSTDDIEWTFEGGMPETSTESNPVVTYEESGTYQVKLKVSNGELSDSLIVDEFINVLTRTEAPFVENFEQQNEELEGWIVTEPIQGFTWEFQPEVGFMSDNSLFLENYNIVSDSEFEFTSQIVDLSQSDTAFISMRAAFAKKLDSSYEAIRVFINTDCGDEWQFKKLFSSSNALPSVEPTDDYFIPGSEEEWNYLLVNNIQPEERTETFRFRLVFFNNGGNNLYIDDINLSQNNILNVSEQPEFEGKISLFPNPTASDLTIGLSLEKKEDVILRLFGNDGKLVIQDGPINLQAGDHSMLLSMSGMSPGAYILEIQGNSGVAHRKVILSKD